MAFPFGGHPTLATFMEWATKVGCKAEAKVRTHEVSGQPYEVLEITSPRGGHVALASPDYDEHLAPSMVAYLQRRLGIKSPFPATPEHGDPKATVYVKEDGSVLPSDDERKKI